jgi:hypothetical protein
MSNFHNKIKQFKIKHELNDDLSNEELQQCLIILQTQYLKTIKNCVLFFTILVIIGLAISFIFGFINGFTIATAV